MQGLGGGGDSSSTYDLSPSLLSLDSLGALTSTQEQHSSCSANTIAPLPSCLQPKGTNARTRKVLQQLFGGAEPSAKRAALAKPSTPDANTTSLFGSLLSHAWSAPADFYGAADSQVATETSSYGLLGRSESSTLPSMPRGQGGPGSMAGSLAGSTAAHEAGSSAAMAGALDAGSDASAVQPSVLLSWLQFGGSTAAVACAAGASDARGWQPGDADALAALVERVDSNSAGPQALAPPSIPMAAATSVPVTLMPLHPGTALADRQSSSGSGLGSDRGLVARAGDSFDGLQPEWLEQALLEDDLLPPFDVDDWAPL